MYLVGSLKTTLVAEIFEKYPN